MRNVEKIMKVVVEELLPQLRQSAMENPTPQGFWSSANGATRYLDNALSELPRDCQKGCAMCCFQAVPIMPWEAVVIALALQNDATKISIRDARAGLKNRIKKIDRMDSIYDRYVARVACAFLKDSECQIYDFRPVACRGHLSLSVEACEESWINKESLVPFLADAMDFSGAVSVAVETATELYRPNKTSYITMPLEHAVWAALRAGAVERWFDGEDIFADVPTLTRP
jgi:Fe-S-cluster containining protein